MVVLITKEDSVRRAVLSTLEKAGFVVLPASNAASALALCREAGGPVRLAIIDAGIGLTGELGLLNSLRQASPSIRVIFMSNSVEPEAVAGLARPWQGDRVMQKPFRRAKLLGTVLDVMSEPLTFTA